MKRRKQRKKKKQVLRFSPLVCIVQFIALLDLLLRGLGWPLRMVSRGLHNLVKANPVLRPYFSHSVIGITLGIALIIASFVFSSLFHHPVWEAGLETARAAGVCPIWETLSAAFHFGEDI